MSNAALCEIHRRRAAARVEALIELMREHGPISTADAKGVMGYRTRDMVGYALKPYVASGRIVRHQMGVGRPAVLSLPGQDVPPHMLHAPQSVKAGTWIYIEDDDHEGAYIPTPEQIRQACRQIQAEWSEHEERARRRWSWRPVNGPTLGRVLELPGATGDVEPHELECWQLEAAS